MQKTFFCYFCTKIYLMAMDAPLNCLTDVIPMNTHKIDCGVKFF